MELARVAHRSLADQVYGRLLDEVVTGSVRPGETLPSERKLAEALGVSRPAVREALQRLTQAGMIAVRHGGATTVLDFRRNGGLDLLPHLFMPGGQIDPPVVRSVMEARLTIGPKVAELAAQRRDPVAAAAIVDAVDRLDAAPDPVDRQRRALDFWELIVDAADSLAFRLMFNSLRAAYEPALEALAVVMATEVDRIDAYRVVAAAIGAGDPDRARSLASDLLGPATRAILDVFAAVADG